MTFGPLFELDAIDVIGDPICTDVETGIDNVHNQKKKQIYLLIMTMTTQSRSL